MAKIKLFLGAYVNQTNAQNLNCRALAKFIDKDRFEVYTLEIKHGNLSGLRMKGVRIFKCFFPVKVTGKLGFLWGIYHCDVAYLPRGNFYRYQRFLIKLFKKKSFKTIENVLDDIALKSAVAVVGDESNLKEAYGYCDELYSISRFMKAYNYRKYGIRSEELILPVINDTSFFKVDNKVVTRLSEVIFVGNDMVRKGVHDYIALAAQHKDITFHIAGKESNGVDIHALIRENNLENVKYHGIVGHDSLLKILKGCQVYILPSRSEGFPKAIIEAAAASVPTLTYADYGADEWITNHQNGYVARDVEDMSGMLEKYKNDIPALQKISTGAAALAEVYEVKSVVNMYEKIIEGLYHDAK